MKRLGLLVVGALLAGCGGSEEATLLPKGRAIAVERSFDPSLHLFGDTVTARFDMLVDRRLLDPERLTLETEFEPYELLGSQRVERRDDGPYTRLAYRATLRCLTQECIPGVLASAAGAQESGRGERRTFQFRPARILYTEPDAKRPELLLPVTWPPLASVSRINEAQAGAAFPFRASTSPLPELTARVAPLALALALVLLALVLLAWPAVLLARWWRRRHPAPEPPVETLLSSLEHALALVRWSVTQPQDGARREALEMLAVALAEAGSNGLVSEARELAWSPRSPAPEPVAALARRIEEGDEALA